MGVEDDLKRLEEKHKVAMLQIEKRLVNLETGLTELQNRISLARLAPEQEQRVAAVEERVENAEDLEMLNRMDIIKMKEMLGKEGTGMPAADLSIISRRIDDIESTLQGLNEKISVGTIDTSKIRGFEKIIERAEKIDAAKVSKNVEELKEDFDSFKKETEESIKKIVAISRRIIEHL